MATKAQLFRYLSERSRPKREKRTRGAPQAKAHHRPTVIESRAAYALEDSGNKRPSRKSTRRSKNRQKPESQLARRQIRKIRSPEERAARAALMRVS